MNYILEAMLGDAAPGATVNADVFIEALTELNGDLSMRNLDLLTVEELIREVSKGITQCDRSITRSMLQLHKSLNGAALWHDKGTSPDADLENAEHFAKLLYKSRLVARSLGVDMW